MSERVLPDWLDAYIEYTKYSEAPLSYHTWTGLTILAAALGRNWQNTTTNTPIYNNLFTILIAAQGSTRKSSAMRIGLDLIEPIPQVKISSPVLSEASLLEEMIASGDENPYGHSNYLVFSHELHSLIVTSGIDLLHTLMSVYDQTKDFTKYILARGQKTVKAPYLNFIAATTPAYISKAFTEDFRHSGMTSRTLFIYEEKSRFLNPIYTPGDTALKDALIHDLRVIADMKEQTVEFSNKAYKNIYQPYYMSREDREAEAPYELQKAFIARSDNHAIKVSALMALSRGSRIVDTQDLNRAMQLLNKIEEDLPIVDQLLGQDKHAAIKTNFERWLSAVEVANINHVYKRYRKEMNMGEVDNMVAQYVASRLISFNAKNGRIEWIAP